MSDERYYPERSSDASDSLPAELAGVQARLESDGAVWRQSVPPPERVVDHLHTTYPADALPAHPRMDQMTRLSRLITGPSAVNASIAPRRPLGLAASVAVIAIVALMGVLLHNALQNRPTSIATQRTSTPTLPQATATTTPGRQQSSQDWLLRPGLVLPNGFNYIQMPPTIAPSDPSVIYRITGTPARLSRTDDDGGAWTALPWPADISQYGGEQMFVSPLDPHVVFLTLLMQDASVTEANCPSLQGSQQARVTGGGVLPLSLTGGFISCSYQYVSTDGGAHWSPLHLPVSGVLARPLSMNPALWQPGPVYAQGSVLYSLANCGLSCSGPGSRIVRSTDGGSTWTLADGDIRATGAHICDMAVAPTGSVVFAITASDACSRDTLPPLTLWRSLNGGASWLRVGPTPSANVTGLTVVDTSDPTRPLLYAYMPASKAIPHTVQVVDSPDALQVSADLGAHWSHAPTTGFPNASAPANPLGTLHDGSVVVAVSTANSNGGVSERFYAWKSGDTSWRQVAAQVDNPVTQVLIIPTKAGHDAFWALTQITSPVFTPAAGRAADQPNAIAIVEYGG